MQSNTQLLPSRNATIALFLLSCVIVIVVYVYFTGNGLNIGVTIGDVFYGIRIWPESLSSLNKPN